MNLVDLLKKNIVMVPVVASVLVGTFTGVKYIVNSNRHHQRQSSRNTRIKNYGV
jgi:hypothetical protein